MRQPALIAIAAVVVATTTSCGRLDHTSTVQTRASLDLGCPARSVAVTTLGGGGFRARGCGRTASYVCSVQSGGRYGRAQELCVLESAPTPAPGAGPASWSDDAVDAITARVQDDVMACLPPSRADLELPVVLTAEGRVRRLGDTLAPGTAACVDGALEHVQLEGSREERSTVLRLVRRTSGGDAPVASTSRGPDVSAGQAARAAVDGRARALLACTGEDAMALQISWARDGRLDGAARGVPAGSAEAECVRGILQSLVIDARDASGSTLHAVQR